MDGEVQQLAGPNRVTLASVRPGHLYLSVACHACSLCLAGPDWSHPCNNPSITCVAAWQLGPVLIRPCLLPLVGPFLPLSQHPSQTLSLSTPAPAVLQPSRRAPHPWLSSLTLFLVSPVAAGCSASPQSPPPSAPPVQGKGQQCKGGRDPSHEQQADPCGLDFATTAAHTSCPSRFHIPSPQPSPHLPHAGHGPQAHPTPTASLHPAC